MSESTKLTIGYLLEASARQIDESMKELMRTWHEPPYALEILEVLDKSAQGGLASPFTMRTLDLLLVERMEQEGVTYPELVTQAHWRKED